jgi:hypothetical protein
MGFVKELGLWACLDKFDKKMNKVFAFYMYEPNEVTDKGKTLLQKCFQSTLLCTLIQEPGRHTENEDCRYGKAGKTESGSK